MSERGSERKSGIVFHLAPINPGVFVFDKETQKFGFVATTGENGKLLQTGGRDLRTENFVPFGKLPLFFLKSLVGLPTDTPVNDNTPQKEPQRRRAVR